ncbi:MAG: sulfotransferase [Arenimonas sp.]
MAEDAGALWQAGQDHIRARRLGQARESFERLLALQPRHAPARLLLASVLLAQGGVRAAAEQTCAAAQSLPDDAGFVARVAQALRQLGETNAARACLAHPAVERSREGPALLAISHVHQGMGEHERALQLLERALALGFDSPDLRYYRALQLQFHGRLDEAEAEIEGALRQGPTHGRASLVLARLRKATPQHNQLEFITRRLAQVPAGSEDQAAFEFARYAELEALGRTDEAWAALTRANALMHARLSTHGQPVGDDAALVEAIIAHCPPKFLRATAAPVDAPRPIFIVGMPRSGTTVLESLLGNHPQVAAAGELNDFPKALRWAADCHGHRLVDAALLARLPQVDFTQLAHRYLEQSRWRAGGKPFYIDKLPPNWQVAGLIHKALPDAPILHIRREPIEVCFSNWRAMFGDSYAYSYQLEALAAHHLAYHRLMAHWQQAMPGAILEIDYGALVSDPETTMRAVLEFCGLPFDPACIDTAAGAAPVATLSSAQVRAPLNDRGRRDWQRYAAQLEPLRALLSYLRGAQ